MKRIKLFYGQDTIAIEEKIDRWAFKENAFFPVPINIISAVGNIAENHNILITIVYEPNVPANFKI